MAIHRALNLSRLMVPVAATLTTFAPMLIAHDAAAVTIVVTPGEQNTQSGENGCVAEPCPGGHWLHYPELLQVALGADYAVQNNGDGGAVLGCDATTMTVAGGNSFCASSKYTMSVATPPNIVIIGPFGEHDQRIVGASQDNETTLYDQTVFENAYEGLVQKYLQYTQQIYIMTPIDVPWGGTPTLPNGEDLIKDKMLPAALQVAHDHHLKVIDTYTEISGTPDLVTQYYGADGQVTAAGQQKMADLILAALASGNDTDAGANGGAGEGGASGGTGGAVAEGGTVAEGGAETGGTTSTAGSGGTGGSSGGTENSATGGSAAGESSVATAGTAGTTNEKHHSSSGCALSNDESSWGGGLSLLTILGLAAFARKRRSS